MSEIQTRDQIQSEYKWNLGDIYASESAWNEDAQKLEVLLGDFARVQGTLTESSDALLNGMRLHDAVGQIAGKLYVYAKMNLDEDTSDGGAQNLHDRAIGLMVRSNAVTSFFVPEILGIDESRIESFLSENEALRTYRFAIHEITRQKEHILSPAEEELLAQFGEVFSSPGEVFEMYNNADMVFPSIEDHQGQSIQITHGNYIELLERKDRGVRKRAYEAVHHTYQKHRNTIAAVYAANVKRNVVNARVRRFESARQASLDADNISVAVYDNLIDAVHSSLPALHKYLKLRAKALKIDTLEMYDLFTPLVHDVEWKVSYDEAKSTVLEAVRVFGDTYQRIATDGLNNRWVDVYETKGKRSGAYSWGTFGTHPYILLNHNDTIQDMFTLAHELGHSMHSYFSRSTQPYVYSDYTTFVAEVASTCNEALLFDYLGRTVTDAAKQAYLVNQQIETIRGTLLTQTLFAEFENQTHAHVEAGGALTADWLDETYYNLNQTYYGPAMNVTDLSAHGWMRIPHFYSAFYVYKYATGISAAIALSRRILAGGEDAISDYIRFLSSGSSNYSIELLRGAGVDMASPEPVKEALRHFDTLIGHLSELIG